jgi:uncharacterized membrane protein YozB (DUF420 family)
MTQMPISNSFVIIVTVSLLVQLAVLGLLLYGYLLKRRLRFQQHGFIMAVAVFLHLTVVFTVMIPSFVLAIIPEYVVANVASATSVVSLIHASFGATALTLGLWFVLGWRLKGLKGCFKRKMYMRWTLIVWATSLLLGIVLYIILYWAALMG